MVPMRKVIYGAGVTLDGYIARPDGSVDFLVLSKESEKLMRKFFAGLDTIIMGRKTAEASQRMAQESGEEPPKGPWKTYVFSRTRPPGKRDGMTWVNQPPAEFLAQIRKRRGKDIFLTGGGELARSFLQDDLIDEIYIGIEPLLIGEGIPLFPPGFPQREFKLVECKPYDNRSVALTYERVRTKTKKRMQAKKGPTKTAR
jgi:dihydrofolate reductase